MGVHTGFRINEILSLRVCDIYNGSEIAKVVHVAKGYMKGKKKARTMPLHEKVREALLALLQSTRMWHPLFRTWSLFHAQGRPSRISTRQAFGIIVSAASKAGLDIQRIGTHSLRKTFAKNMWVSPLVGRDMAKIARLLGHSNWSNTLRYLEFADELDAAVLA
jgi:integrase